MSTITSTLAIRVDDAGFAAKLRADAEAARRLGTDAQGLAKLRANAGTAGLVRQFEKLYATASRVEGYANATRALQTLGAGHRAARVEVERTAATLAQAQRKKAFFDRSRANNSPNYPAFKASGMVAEADAALRRTARAHTAATRTFERTGAALQEQKTSVRALGSELERAGHPLNQIAQVQAGLRGRIDATTAAIRRQATAHEEARVAAAASAAEATRRANAAAAAQRTQAGQRATAQLRATVQGAEGTRAERRAAARAAAAQARRDNSDALARTVQGGRQAREDREERQAQEAARRRNAGRDMAAGMGEAGRQQSADIEGGRRLTDGMSDPARKARAAAEAEANRLREEAKEAKDQQRQAQKTLAGLAGLGIGHKVKEGTKEVLETYKEFDDLRRYQVAVADLTPEESRSRVSQALHLGAHTRYNDLQALHAQLDLAQRGVKKEFIEPFVGEVVHYGQAMNTDLGSAAKTLEGIIFSTGQNVENPETAVKVMRRQVDLAVKASKIGGLDNDDVAQAFKFGGSSGSGAGLSNETMLANFALLRRSGYTGSEAGVAQRAIAGKLVSPTMKGLDALDAMGVKWEDYSKIKRGAAPDLADNMMLRHFGKGLTKQQRSKMQGILEDEDTMGDRGKFVEAAVEAVANSFVQTTGKNKGKLAAKDRASLAKKFGNLHKNLIESIDSEGLWDAIINAAPTLAQANAWGTDKHGGKIMALARKAKEFKEYREMLQHTPEGFAKGIGDQRNAGYAGAAHRLEGSRKNLDSRIGQSLDDHGNGGFLTNVTSAAANATQALAELPDSVVAIGASATWLAGKISSIFGTAALVGASTGIATGVATGKGGAMLAGAAAGAAVAAPVVGTIALTAPLIAADKSKGIVHGGKNVGDAQLNPSDELPGLGGSTDAPSWRRKGSLPPGEAGMPKPAPARLPGLDGRQSMPKPAPAPEASFLRRWYDGASEAVFGKPKVETRLPGLNGRTAPTPSPAQASPAPEGEGALARLHARADEARTSVQAIGNQPVAPQVDTSRIEAVAPRAAEAKTAVETLNLTATPNVDVSSIQAAEAAVDRLLAKLAQIGASAAGATSAVRSIPSPGGQLRGRTSPSFSDGVTPGAGAQ